MPPRQRTRLLAAVVFVGSTLALTTQLINPSPVVVSVGDNGANVTELGGYFQYREVGIITVAATLLGASGTYLLVGGVSREHSQSESAPEPPVTTAEPTDQPDATQPSEDLLESRRQEWEETADRLANKEREVYEAVLDADGVLPQSDIVDETDLSKASVSRALDSLEARNLVERKHRGMGNMVLLL